MFAEVLLIDSMFDAPFLGEELLMNPGRKEPLRTLTETERNELVHVSQSHTDEASRVAHAKEILAVAAGETYSKAAFVAGRCSRGSISTLVTRFNQEGLAALSPRHAGGRPKVYDDTKKNRIVDEFRRVPDRKEDGTSVWSIETLKKALRRTSNDLPKVGHRTVWETLHDAGYSWQKDRSWCMTGKVLRKRKSGIVEVIDPDKEAKKKADRESLYASGSVGA